MQVLQGIISRHAQSPNFKFHWKCEQSRTVMLMFADDLLLFSHGDVASIKILKECLENFARMFGLCANPVKSDCFVFC